MVLSRDVSLPLGVEPRFPERCCRCLAAPATHHVAYAGRRSSIWHWLWAFTWLFAKRVRCRVPFCDACLPRVRWRRRLEVLLVIGVVVLAIVGMSQLVDEIGLSRSMRKLVVLAIAAALLVPYYWWSVSWPPAFDLTVKDDVVDYEFANHDYAAEFVAANAVVFGVDPDGEADDGAGGRG